MRNVHISEMRGKMEHVGIIIYPITEEGIDLYLQPLDGSTKDVRTMVIPFDEYLRFLELSEKIYHATDIIIDSYETEDVEGEQLTDLLEFLTPYKDDIPTIWSEINQAHNAFNRITFSL